VNKKLILDLHFLTFLFIGLSASMWAIFDVRFFMPIAWLIFLCILVTVNNPHEFSKFFKRFTQIGATLLVISILQIVFRRDGNILLTFGNFPLVYSVGLREAILLWIRFMIIFALAYVLAGISIFKFLLFSNKAGFSMNLSLLLLITLKLIPFIFSEAKRSLWFLRFRGIQFGNLPLRRKFVATKQLIFSLLMRSIDYASYSALALEMRGYGKTDAGKIQQAYPLKCIDWGLIGLTIFLNIFGFMK